MAASFVTNLMSSSPCFIFGVPFLLRTVTRFQNPITDICLMPPLHPGVCRSLLLSLRCKLGLYRSCILGREKSCDYVLGDCRFPLLYNFWHEFHRKSTRHRTQHVVALGAFRKGWKTGIGFYDRIGDRWRRLLGLPPLQVPVRSRQSV